MGETRYISREESLTCRKEAIILDGSRHVESFSFRGEGHLPHIINDPDSEEHIQEQHRRRYLHQTAYNRPYPRKRTILLFPENETVSVTSAAGSVTSSSCFDNNNDDDEEGEEDEAKIRSSRRPSSHVPSHSNMNLLGHDDDHDVPHDEFVQDTFPDQEWRGTWVAQTNLDEDNHDKAVLVPESFEEEHLSRNLHDTESLRQPNSPGLQFSTTPHKAPNATTKTSSNISVVTPQTVSTSASTAMEEIDPLEDLFVCASPGDFLLSATELANEFTHPGLESPSARHPNEAGSVSHNSNTYSNVDAAFEYPEFLCHPATDLNFDFEWSKCPSSDDSQQNNNQDMEAVATDVATTPIHPILNIMDNIDISPLSVPCNAGEYVTTFCPASSSSDPECTTNTVEDTTEADPTRMSNNYRVELEPTETLPRQTRRQINRSVHQFLQNRRAEHRLNLYVDEYSTSVFDRIVENLYGNSALKTIEISRGPVSMPQSESPRSFEDMFFLLEAIRCLPHLKTLIVSNMNSFLLPALVENLPSSLVTLDLKVLDETIPTDILGNLIVKKNLTQLHLEAQGSLDIGRLVKRGSRITTLKVLGTSCTMDYVHMQFFADSLFQNMECPLKLLDLQPVMQILEWKTLTACLRFNTRIQTLRVNVVGSTMEEQDDIALDLANLLRVNTTLTSIFNYSHDELIVSGETLSGSFLDALQANTTLRKLRFFQEDPLFWVAKDAILNRNTEKGEYGEVFYTPYATLAAMLPTLKTRLCGHS